MIVINKANIPSLS